MTNGSLTAVFSGRPYADLVEKDPLDDPDPVHVEPFTEVLAAHGFDTAVFNALGIDADLKRGFAHVNPDPLDSTFARGRHPLMSAALANGAIRFLSRSPLPRFFVWAHFPDVHAPYRVEENEYPGVPPYARDVLYTDRHVGRLLWFLEKSGLMSRTALVVTADHGEELRARGRHGHGPNLFEEVTRVPLLVAVPGCPPRRVDEPVSLTELAATLTALAGIPTAHRTLFDTTPRRLPVVVEEDPHAAGTYKVAVYGPRYKLMIDPQNGGRMLFDLDSDPGELWNLYPDLPDVARELEAGYQRWLDAPGAR
jgi:hypothetical protein